MLALRAEGPNTRVAGGGSEYPRCERVAADTQTAPEGAVCSV